MTAIGLVGLGVLVLFVFLLLLFAAVSDRWPAVFRRIPAFEAFQTSIERAVEAGERVHFSLGTGSAIGSDSAPAYAGLALLGKVARQTSMSDKPVVATSGDGTLTLLSQDTLRTAYKDAGASDRFRMTSGRLLGPTPFSYIAGIPVLLGSEDVSNQTMLGSFGGEGGLAADFADKQKVFVLAGTDEIQTQAMLYSIANYALIGEEVFAGGAYLDVGRLHKSSLRTQDAVRYIIVGAILLGTLIQTLGFGL